MPSQIEFVFQMQKLHPGKTASQTIPGQHYIHVPMETDSATNQRQGKFRWQFRAPPGLRVRRMRRRNTVCRQPGNQAGAIWSGGVVKQWGPGSEGTHVGIRACVEIQHLRIRDRLQPAIQATRFRPKAGIGQRKLSARQL